MQEIHTAVWEKTNPAINIIKILAIMSLKVSEILLFLILPFKCSFYQIGNHYLQYSFVFLFFLLDFSTSSGDFRSFSETLDFCTSNPHSFPFSSLPYWRVSAPLPYSLFSCCSSELPRQLSLSPGETIREFRSTTKENKCTRVSPHITLCYLPPHFPP